MFTVADLIAEINACSPWIARRPSCALVPCTGEMDNAGQCDVCGSWAL